MSAPGNLSEHARRARAMWNAEAVNWVELGRRQWARAEPNWGMWEVPENEVGILPDVRGLDVVDLGCGTGYWCAWLSRLGARPVGLDVSEAQLDTARSLQHEFGVSFPLIHASAESVPLPEGCCDLAFSEYGAAIWCDRRVWIAEAHRILRPGGWLIFLANSVLAMLCAPSDDRPVGTSLQRPQRGMHRLDWDDEEAPNFCLPHAETFAALVRSGFAVKGLYELYASDGAPEEQPFFVTRGWGQQWPCEEVWVAQRRPERT